MIIGSVHGTETKKQAKKVIVQQEKKETTLPDLQQQHEINDTKIKCERQQ